MNIVCCTDHNYIMPTGVMLCSICVNHLQEHINFFVICDLDVTDDDKTDLKKIISGHHHNIEFIDAPNFTYETRCFTLNKEGQPNHITISSYYRLFLAELLPKNIDRIIYVDGDIIVRHSLLEMYNTCIDNIAVGVITDMEEGSIYKFNTLRYEPSLGYFNAGVLLINLKYWRDRNVLQTFIDFATDFPERVIAHDQDILNYVFRECKKQLHLKYNVQNGFFYKKPNLSWKYEDELIEAISDPYIVHFTCGGINKPWVRGCNVPYREEFIKYKNLTQWRDEPLKTLSSPLKTQIKSLVKKILIKTGFIVEPEDKYISL